MTAAQDRTPFFGSGRGVVFLSPGIYWRPSKEIGAAAKWTSGLAVYDKLVVSSSSWKPLARALHWLHEATGEAALDLQQPM